MPDIVQQRRGRHDRRFVGRHALEHPRVLEAPQRAVGEVKCAERVLEARMGGARIDEMGEPELAHVAQPLDDRRVGEPQEGPVNADVVPEGVADEGHVGQMADGRRQILNG